MSDHSHDNHGQPPAGVVGTLDPWRFEKQEREFFDEEDRKAGVAIGRLLAAFFCILLTLMVSVTTWMVYNANTSDDPTVGVGTAHHTDEH